MVNEWLANGAGAAMFSVWLPATAAEAAAAAAECGECLYLFNRFLFVIYFSIFIIQNVFCRQHFSLVWHAPSHVVVGRDSLIFYGSLAGALNVVVVLCCAVFLMMISVFLYCVPAFVFDIS